MKRYPGGMCPGVPGALPSQGRGVCVCETKVEAPEKELEVGLGLASYLGSLGTCQGPYLPASPKDCLNTSLSTQAQEKLGESGSGQLHGF